MKTFAASLGALAIILIASTPISAAAPDEPAPPFQLKDLQGKTLSLADYKGKVLFLNFWATWCPPCRAEIPDFIEAYRQYNARGMEILGVSVDKMTEEKLLDFVNGMKINYPVALADAGIVNDFRPGQYIPATIIIDKKGVIRYREVGGIDKETLVRYFEELSREN